MKSIAAKLTAAVGLVCLTAAATAQGPGGGGPGGPGGGGFTMPPGMMAKFKAWTAWRAAHPHVGQLQATTMALGRMQDSPETKLNRDQARKVLSILNKWRDKPVMSDEQAQSVNSQLTGVLSLKQLKRLSTMSAGRGGGMGGGRPGGGGPGGGGGRPGGPGGRPGGPGGPGGFKMPDPKDYNPLNPDSSPFVKMNPQMATMVHQRTQQFISSLQQAAK